MSEEIGAYLEGGPADGQTRWCRGSQIKVAVRPPMSLRVLEGPYEPVDYAEHIYERTERDRSGYVVFEHRPR